MSKEGLIDTLIGKVREFRSGASSVVLAELSDEFRDLILKSTATDLRPNITMVSNKLLDQGGKGLNTRQISEAVDAWELMNGKISNIKGATMSSGQ